jgi:hypothetical protein
MSEPKVENYLARVRTALRGLPQGEIDDILRELRSTADELGDADTALRSLGDPVDLAKTYRVENQMVQAECSGSALAILQGLRHASKNRIGRLLLTSAYVFGYANVVTLWVAAIDKLFWPGRTGLWYTPGDFLTIRLVTDGRPPAGTTEMLGWWLVPAVVLAGFALRYLVDRVALLWIRRYRKSNALRVT